MLKSFLFKLKDHRRRQGTRYEIGAIWLCAILAVLSGAKSYRQISRFIKKHYPRLAEVIGLEWKRRPAYTTIRAIIQETDPIELESCFRTYSGELAGEASVGTQIVIDGKVLRGSFDHFADQKAIQMLSFFAAECKIILAHEEIAVKTNEIPTAQELIRELGLSGYLFTLDALHCQAETVKVVKDTGNEVVVQVKANQPTLLNDCQTIASSQPAAAVYQEPFTKTHNRIESRQVSVFLSPTFTHAQKWADIETVLKVERHRQSFDTKTKSWKDSHETAFYISTTVLPAQQFCHIVRQHWGIENRDHYVRDVTLGEDRSRIRTNPDRFARLRSFVLNIFRHNQITNVSDALFDNAISLDSLLLYKSIF